MICAKKLFLETDIKYCLFHGKSGFHLKYFFQVTTENFAKLLQPYTTK